jgi:hypothetical protein
MGKTFTTVAKKKLERLLSPMGGFLLKSVKKIQLFYK